MRTKNKPSVKQRQVSEWCFSFTLTTEDVECYFFDVYFRSISFTAFLVLKRSVNTSNDPTAVKTAAEVFDRAGITLAYSGSTLLYVTKVGNTLPKELLSTTKSAQMIVYNV